MIKIICDRCRQEITENTRNITIKVNDGQKIDTFGGGDYCERCAEEIEAFIVRELVPVLDPPEVPIYSPGHDPAAGPIESSPLAAGQTDKRSNKRNTRIDMGKVNVLREAGWSIGKIAEEMRIPPEEIAEKIFDRKVQEQESTRT